MPSVIENANGMIMIVQGGARPDREVGEVDPGELAAVLHAVRVLPASVSAVIIRKPTRISAGAVACGGTIPMIGAKNMNGKKRAPARPRPTQSARRHSARSRLDVGRRGRGRRRSARDRGEQVDEEGLADVLHAPVLVEVPRRLADADERAHRVEEVREEEREGPDDRRDQRQLREGVEVEVPEQREVGRLVDVVRPRGSGREAGGVVVGLVDDRRQDRRRDDPDQQVAADATGAQDDGQDQSEEGDRRSARW